MFVTIFSLVVFLFCFASWRNWTCVVYCLGTDMFFNWSTFYWTKSITKLIVFIKSFVNTDVVLQAASSGLFLTTFDLVFGTFNRANAFTAITIGVKIVTYGSINFVG